MKPTNLSEAILKRSDSDACPRGLCDGDGDYYDSKRQVYVRCPCQLDKHLKSWMGGPMAAVRISTLEPRSQDQATAKLAMRALPRGSLYIHGNNRSGKTWMAAALFCEEYHKRRPGMRWINEAELKRKMHERLMDRGAFSPVTVKKVRNRDLRALFIDDLGKSKVSESYRQELYELVNEIFNRRDEFQLVITSEYKLADLADPDGDGPDYGKAICRRIADTCRKIKVGTVVPAN